MGRLVSENINGLWRSTFVAKVKQRTVFLFSITSRDPDRRSREQALNALLLGTIALTFGALVVVVSNALLLQLAHLMPRVGLITALLAGMLVLYGLFKRGNYKLPTYGLLGLYFTAAVVVFVIWGTNNPMGLLLCAFVIILAGILLGARYAVYALLVVIGLLAGLTWLAIGGVIQPDLSWGTSLPDLYDVVVFGIILANVAVASWLFNRSMEQSLDRARRSEKALRGQKKLLEVKVEKRTREVQAAHLERVQELYRFAELGHMSVALLHDMANYLTVLSLDIEDLKQERENRSAVVRRVQQSIRHLNNLIGQVRVQIKGETAVIKFNIADEVAHIMRILEYKAEASHVTLAWQTEPNREALFYQGSINHFWQIIMNIISNGIDAYGTDPRSKNVLVSVTRTEKGIKMQVTDFGKGIPASKQEKIFEPFYSTKKNGTGMGLAIAKRMVEKDFGGTIQVTSDKKTGTIFTIFLPHAAKTSH